MTPNHKIQALIKSLGIIPEDEHYEVAELIVRECMELGDKALQDGKWPGDVLKEHFGVE